ncbi:MAG: polyphosphate kinase 2 family protein [Bacteroidetes bacterium]|nr:polyphosphate kinase 2 family protein [Bacteroidota bacterium]MBU1719303.1 polyphosphate kinase 2 family protein [Bacteroidota bacterium]
MIRINELKVNSGKDVKISDFDPAYKGDFKRKKDAKEFLHETIQKLSDLQDVLYASDRYALLLIFQAMDAAGKDGAIKHVMSGINPQGCQVFSFKQPSVEELEHNYLWRNYKALPERGRIGIFNRSYYEEVLVTRVHPEYLLNQRLPDVNCILDVDKRFWKRRFEQINNFEKNLIENGTIVLKFFLNVSLDEQKNRFLERIDNPEKNWKFSTADIEERKYWDKYMEAYEDMFSHTSTKWAPWHIIPADNKWFSRAAIGHIIADKLESLNLQYPKVSEEKKAELEKIREILINEQ